MTRRPSSAPPIDHARDRSRWAELIRDVHEVVEAGGRVTARELGDRANTARTTWTPLAGYPDGPACVLFATATWAWARAADGERRDQLRGFMLATAGMVDQLMASSMPVAAAALPEAIVGSASPRLPYREG